MRLHHELLLPVIILGAVCVENPLNLSTRLVFYSAFFHSMSCSLIYVLCNIQPFDISAVISQYLLIQRGATFQCKYTRDRIFTFDRVAFCHGNSRHAFFYRFTLMIHNFIEREKSVWNMVDRCGAIIWLVLVTRRLYDYTSCLL